MSDHFHPDFELTNRGCKINNPHVLCGCAHGGKIFHSRTRTGSVNQTTLLLGGQEDIKRKVSMYKRYKVTKRYSLIHKSRVAMPRSRTTKEERCNIDSCKGCINNCHLCGCATSDRVARLKYQYPECDHSISMQRWNLRCKDCKRCTECLDCSHSKCVKDRERDRISADQRIGDIRGKDRDEKRAMVKKYLQTTQLKKLQKRERLIARAEKES